MKTWKERVKSDYSEIRGVHHGPREGASMEQLDRELGYAQRLRINSVRIFIQDFVWRRKYWIIPDCVPLMGSALCLFFQAVIRSARMSF